MKPTFCLKRPLFIPREWPTIKWFDSIPYSSGLKMKGLDDG